MFFKNLFFLSIKPVTRSIENAIKIRFESTWLDRCSIGVGLIEIDFQSIESNFWSIENQLENFLKKAFLTCSSHYSYFFKKLSLSSSSTDPLQVDFCRFLPNFSQGFCVQVSVRPFYPLVFILFTIFMHFRWNFQTYRFFGVFIFELVSFKFDHWVFVLKCCKHVSYALIWLIWWFENNLKF